MTKKQMNLVAKRDEIRAKIRCLEQMATAGFYKEHSLVTFPRQAYKTLPGCDKFVKLIFSEIKKLERQFESVLKEIDKAGGVSSCENPFPVDVKQRWPHKDIYAKAKR